VGHSAHEMSAATTEPQAPSFAVDGVAPARPSCAAIVWRAIWASRLVVLLGGVLAVLSFGLAPESASFDLYGLTRPFGYFGNLLAAPFARWDSSWYLAVAQFGYHHQLLRTAFFPLYPAMIHWLGLVLAGNYLIAGVLISLACFAIGLVCLYRLALLDLGPEQAEMTVMLIAFCPVAYYFSAVYTESLFLALSVACVWRARLGSWWSAAVLGALAALSRNGGAILIVPFVLLFLYGPREDAPVPTSRWARGGFRRWRRLLPRHRFSAELLWAILIPVGLLAVLVYMSLSYGSALAPFHAETAWYHHFAGPFGGVWAGIVAGWEGLRQLVHGPAPPIYFDKAGGDPLMVGGANLMLLGFLVLGFVGLVGVFRTLPFAYGAYILASMALPLSEPVTPQPLQSVPRYEVVLFPLFMWAGRLLVRRRMTTWALPALAVFLGVFTAEFSTWRWVA
jgi:mannosyltransferase PIG-V